MRRPAHLTDPIARQFWEAHVQDLEKSGVLNPRTFTAFTMLSQTYADYRNSEDDHWRLKFLQEFTKLAKSFGLIPHAAQTREARVHASKLRQVSVRKALFRASPRPSRLACA
jgi:phage terminase small subunit